MRTPSGSPWGAALCALVLLVACDDDGAGAEGEGTDATPLVGVLELPVSMRTGDGAPSDAYEVQIGTGEVRVQGESLGAFAGGSVPAELTSKLALALSKSPHKKAAIEVHSSAPYGATSAILDALAKAGVTEVAFKVRKASGTETGWMAMHGFGSVPTSASDAVVTVPGTPDKTWADFEAAWEAVYEACGGSDSGNCAYKPAKIAQEGKLKIVLFAAGQGVNVNFYRTGAPAPEEPEAAADANKDAKDAKADAPTDPAAEVENAPPATEALFQFRAKEALKSPSAITATLAPVCGEQACGVIVRGEPGTPMMRIVSMLGAAFPDGGKAPHVLFER